MRCTYFVSYVKVAPLSHGYGRCEIQRDQPIERIEDLLEIEQTLKAEHPGLGEVLILNFQLLRGEEGEPE